MMSSFLGVELCFVGHQRLIRTEYINNDWDIGLRGVRRKLSMRFRRRVVRRGIEVARAPRNSSNSLMALDGTEILDSLALDRWTGRSGREGKGEKARRRGPPAGCFIVLWCANNISTLETNCAASRRRIRGQLRRLRTHDTVYLLSINSRLGPSRVAWVFVFVLVLVLVFVFVLPLGVRPCQICPLTRHHFNARHTRRSFSGRPWFVRGNQRWKCLGRGWWTGFSICLPKTYYPSDNAPVSQEIEL